MDTCIICNKESSEQLVKNPQQGSYNKVVELAARWEKCGDYRVIQGRLTKVKADEKNVT